MKTSPHCDVCKRVITKDEVAKLWPLQSNHISYCPDCAEKESIVTAAYCYNCGGLKRTDHNAVRCCFDNEIDHNI